jgi:hypothetical protein
VQSIVAAINKFFTSEIRSRDQVLDQAYSEDQNIRHAVNEFLISLSIALSLDPVTFSDFFWKKELLDLISLKLPVTLRQNRTISCGKAIRWKQW